MNLVFIAIPFIAKHKLITITIKAKLIFIITFGNMLAYPNIANFITYYFTHFAKLSPNPTQLGAELVIFPFNPATHPTTRHTRKVVSRPRMTLTSKAKLLVSIVRP